MPMCLSIGQAITHAPTRFTARRGVVYLLGVREAHADAVIALLRRMPAELTQTPRHTVSMTP